MTNDRAKPVAQTTDPAEISEQKFLETVEEFFRPGQRIRAYLFPRLPVKTADIAVSPRIVFDRSGSLSPETTDDYVHRTPHDNGICDYDENDSSWRALDASLARHRMNRTDWNRYMFETNDGDNFDFDGSGIEKWLAAHPELQMPVVPVKHSFLNACNSHDEKPCPSQASTTGEEFTPAREPVYGTVQNIKGFVLLLDPGCAQFLQSLKTLDLDLTKSANEVRITTPLFVSGTVFYTPKTPEDMKDLLKEGAPVQIKTCIPPQKFIGDTFVFDNTLQFRTKTVADGTVSLDIVDPRPPGQIEGTPEYAAQFRSLKYAP